MLQGAGIMICGGFTFRIYKVNDSAVILEQVNFLNPGDVVHAETFEGALEFRVISSSVLVYCLLLAADGTRSSCAYCCCQSC